MQTEYILYSGKLDDGTLWNFYEHPHIITMMCGSKKAYKVKVTICNEGTYYGWYENKEEKVIHIYPNEALVEMCFPYGSAIETKHGKGNIVKLKVEEI